MANEITVNFSASVRNGNLAERIEPGTKQFTQTSIGGPYPGYITVGTIEETVSLSEVGTLGFCFIQNLDTTNYIRLGFSTGVYGLRLNAGEFAWLRLNTGITLYAIANTAACKVLVKAFEN